MPNKYLFEIIKYIIIREHSLKKSVSKTVQNLDTFFINFLRYCFYNIKSVQKTDTFLNSLKNNNKSPLTPLYKRWDGGITSVALFPRNDITNQSIDGVFQPRHGGDNLPAGRQGMFRLSMLKGFQKSTFSTQHSVLSTKTSAFSSNKGFTLLELLLVVIVLGILAAVAIPQFTDMTKDAKEAALKSTLASLRNAIELYSQQHKFIYPGDKKYTDGTSTATAQEREDSFINQLTLYSKDDGRTSASLDRTNYPYGPYLKQGIPANPLAISPSGTEKGALVGTATTTITAEASPTKGWRASTKTGQIIANNSLYETW